MDAGMSMIVWFVLTLTVYQNGCGLSAQNLDQPYSVALSPYKNSGVQGRLIPVFSLNNLFNKNPANNNNNAAALAALQREINALTTRVTALETSVNRLKARIATLNNTINCTNGYKLVLGHCYKYFTTAKTFVQSRTACVAEGAVLAIPRISGANNRWGIGIRRAFPAANNFWIGVFYTASSTVNSVTTDSDAFDFDGNEIGSDTPRVNPRWTGAPTPPPNIQDPNGNAAAPPFGVYVTIPSATPGRWTITPDPRARNTALRAYLCEK